MEAQTNLALWVATFFIVESVDVRDLERSRVERLDGRKPDLLSRRSLGFFAARGCQSCSCRQRYSYQYRNRRHGSSRTSGAGEPTWCSCEASRNRLRSSSLAPAVQDLSSKSHGGVCDSSAQAKVTPPEMVSKLLAHQLLRRFYGVAATVSVDQVRCNTRFVRMSCVRYSPACPSLF